MEFKKSAWPDARGGGDFFLKKTSRWRHEGGGGGSRNFPQKNSAQIGYMFFSKFFICGLFSVTARHEGGWVPAKSERHVIYGRPLKDYSKNIIKSNIFMGVKIDFDLSEFSSKNYD